VADPNNVHIEVRNAIGQPIPGAKAKLVVRRGVEWREDKGEAAAPVTHTLRAGFIQVEVDAAAPDYIPERGSGLRWECTNPAWSLREEQETAILQVALGRVWFAPIVALPEDQQVRTPFNPGGVLVTANGYRTVGLNRERFRTLRQPAAGNPDDPGWDRFLWDEQAVNLAERGNWLILEYGDPSGGPDSLRHLIGVWAPHTFSGDRPPVVVQITPNTRPPYYPADGLPFSGLYPYGCVAQQVVEPDKKKGVEPDKKTRTVALRNCRQAYVELPSNRCLGQYKIVYQLYAARPDIFDGPHGPIVITLSPALLRQGGILREPFNRREGMGRLIAEVLRFLWSRKLTLGMTVGSLHLRFRPPKVELGGARPVVTATGFPSSSLTTVVCHSAGVGPALELAGHAAGAEFPEQFPVTLFGGPNDYCERNWQSLWVIDGGWDSGRHRRPVAGEQCCKDLADLVEGR
jgi:hypothetical protein